MHVHKVLTQNLPKSMKWYVWLIASTLSQLLKDKPKTSKATLESVGGFYLLALYLRDMHFHFHLLWVDPSPISAPYVKSKNEFTQKVTMTMESDSQEAKGDKVTSRENDDTQFNSHWKRCSLIPCVKV